MLTENEWNTINNMLLELYTIDELDVFTSKIMKMIRKRQIHRRFLQ